MKFTNYLEHPEIKKWLLQLFIEKYVELQVMYMNF